MKKQRVDISRYKIHNNIIFHELITSKFPIEYQFLLQEYLVKLWPFYVIAKQNDVPDDVIVKILKIRYASYFLHHTECHVKSHVLGVAYLEQSFREIYNLPNLNVQHRYEFTKPNSDKQRVKSIFMQNDNDVICNTFMGRVKDVLQCDICAMGKSCKYEGCATLICDASMYCKTHMRCDNCNFNIRLEKCECDKQASVSKYCKVQGFVSTLPCRYAKVIPTVMNYSKIYLGKDEDNHLLVPNMKGLSCGNDNQLQIPCYAPFMPEMPQGVVRFAAMHNVAPVIPPFLLGGHWLQDDLINFGDD